MKRTLHAIVFAALLGGCGGAKLDYRNDKDTFGQAFTSEWRQQNAPAAAVGAEPPSDANKERDEFEEWKRKNQK